jgi:Arc/MetJ family transcription regulator
MRTNIDIDDDLIAKAIELSLLKTKKDVVEQALKEFVKIAQRRRMDHLRGTFNWEGNLQEWRENRINYVF